MLEPILGINERETDHLTVIYLQAPLAPLRIKGPPNQSLTNTQLLAVLECFKTGELQKNIWKLEMMYIYISRVKTKTRFLLSMSCLMSMLVYDTLGNN